jgi:class 3 adenylate cyclase
MRILPSVKAALLVFFTLVVVGMAASILLLVRYGLMGPGVPASACGTPREGVAAANALMAERFENLSAKALAFAESPALKEALSPAQPRPAQVGDVVRELMPETNTVLVLVLGRGGALLFDTRSGEAPRNAPAWPSLQASLQGSTSRTCVEEGGRLYQSVSVPVAAPGRVLGTITVLLPLDPSFASLLKSMSGNDVALFLPGRCLNTTSPSLSPARADSLLGPRLPGGARPASAFPSTFEVVDGKDRLDSAYIALPGTGTETPPGFLVLLRTAATRPVWEAGWPLYAVAGFWLALGLLFALVTARIAAGPLKRIEKVIERAELGDLKGVVELPGSHEAAPLAHTVNRFISNWQERELYKNILGKYAPQSTVKKLLASGEPPALEGERRSVVMLACGIRGFSAFTENADPAKLSKGLNDFFTLMSNFVFQHEGLVDKFVGDSFLAFWGAPLPQEDAEMSAVRAALQMQESLRDFNADRVKQNLHPMMVGIGIVTGEVVVGNLGSEQNPDYTVIGDEVALVMKLASKANSGQVVVADSAFQKVKDRVEVNPLAPIVQKGIASRGFTEPVRIHVVTDLKT